MIVELNSFLGDQSSIDWMNTLHLLHLFQSAIATFVDSPPHPFLH